MDRLYLQHLNCKSDLCVFLLTCFIDVCMFRWNFVVCTSPPMLHVEYMLDKSDAYCRFLLSVSSRACTLSATPLLWNFKTTIISCHLCTA